MKFLNATVIDTDEGYVMVQIETEEYEFVQAFDDEDGKLQNNNTMLEFLQQAEEKDVVPEIFFNKEDFTEREQEIAQYLFNFLWDSCNGVNTFVDQDVYEDDGFTLEEMKNFVEKYGGDGLEFYDDNDDNDDDNNGDTSVNIMWDFLTHFNLKTWHPVETRVNYDSDEEYDEDDEEEDGEGGKCRILVDFDDLDEIHRLLDENGIDYEDL